jgi:alkaline phosphatase
MDSAGSANLKEGVWCMRKHNSYLMIAAGAVILSTVVLGFNNSAGSGEHRLAEDVSSSGSAKNIIFMVADGMGLADVTAARIYKNGLDGESLYFETLDNIGYQRTYSADSVVTDSAAAASAWACGEKFNNGEICYHADTRSHPLSILELAEKRGKATGLVATYTITHATPAAFAAHVRNRRCEHEIARQYIEDSGVDVLLGGGSSMFKSWIPDACGTSGDFIREAEQQGYVVVYSEEEMKTASRNVRRLLGLFSERYMLPEALRGGTGQPTLAEMTSSALDILEEDEEGFFLFVEGSQVDGGNHVNNLEYQVSEVLSFDDAVKVVLDWINKSPERRENTLLIVVSDHETGGFAINGPQDDVLGAGELVEAGWTTKSHTGVDTVLWSQGPGSRALGRALENTDIYRVMVESLN